MSTAVFMLYTPVTKLAMDLSYTRVLKLVFTLGTYSQTLYMTQPCSQSEKCRWGGYIWGPTHLEGNPSHWSLKHSFPKNVSSQYKYSWCTFMDCYSVFSLLHAYFLPIHENGEILVLRKLPYLQNSWSLQKTFTTWHSRTNARAALLLGIKEWKSSFFLENIFVMNFLLIFLRHHQVPQAKKQIHF
jgi:hypothetical protein